MCILMRPTTFINHEKHAKNADFDLYIEKLLKYFIIIKFNLNSSNQRYFKTIAATLLTNLRLKK